MKSAMPFTLPPPPLDYLNIPVIEFQTVQEQEPRFKNVLSFKASYLEQNKFLIPALEKELQAILQLKYNWDGYGAISISLDVIHNVRELLSRLPYSFVEFLSIDDIQPTPNGTITIEWTKNNDVVSVELGSKTANFYARFKDQKPDFREGIKISEKIPLLLLENIGRIIAENS